MCKTLFSGVSLLYPFRLLAETLSKLPHKIKITCASASTISLSVPSALVYPGM